MEKMEEEKVRELERISQGAAALGFNVLFVSAGSPLATQRQLAVRLIEKLVTAYELENVVSIRKEMRG